MIHSSSLRLPIIMGAALTLMACGNSGTETPNATNVSEPVKVAEKAVVETSAAPEVLTVEMTQEAMLKRGRIVWFKCRSCHELGADGPHKVGPNLHQIMGATAGVKPGFVYSEAMKTSGVVWDEETLDAFVKKPTDYVKGTKMAFVGIRKQSDRDALIAYMIENSEPAE